MGMRKSRYLSVEMTNTAAGLVGEAIAMAAILQKGWGCAMAQTDFIDLICWSKQSGEKYLVQVKSTQMTKGDRINRLQFQIGIGGTRINGSKKKRLPTRYDYDILALVSVEHRSALFYPVSSVKQFKISRHVNMFVDPEHEYDTWHNTIEVLNDYT